MKFLVFDTETTGFPQRLNGHNYSPDQIEKYNSARIVSIAFMVLGEDFETLAEHYYVIKPSGFEIPESATKIHGITTEYALKNGVDFAYVASRLQEVLFRYKDIEYFVAHNVYFDYNILLSELYRLDDQENIQQLKKLKRYCTMKKSMHLFPKRKFPKLVELYEYLFPNHKMIDAHNALYDAKHCAECFQKFLVMYPQSLDE